LCKAQVPFSFEKLFVTTQPVWWRASAPPSFLAVSAPREAQG
jgi:hypothetical protein